MIVARVIGCTILESLYFEGKFLFVTKKENNTSNLYIFESRNMNVSL